ncbi:MAG: winged helix-turn-helix transcriptional regulator [Burkholderiaceae bacterium]|nr:winged helix-turn-helix transcriptional regulator [Burkholderiaceae bacterium]
MTKPVPSDAPDSDGVFTAAAELFGLLSTPVRLRIVVALGEGELNVSQLLERVDATQPNLSQHLATLYRSGLLARRRLGAQVLYRLAGDRARMLCDAVLAEHDAASGATRGR